MFNNLGWGETGFLLIFALLIFGPDKLPRMAQQAGRLVRQLRQMAAGVTDDLKKELGDSGLDLRDELRGLDPKRLLADEPTPARSRPAVAAASLSPHEPAPFDPDAT